MSFSSTPLGQGRRLDHHTFLNKPASSSSTTSTSSNHIPSRPSSPPRRQIPASYAYGASTLVTRSPPKPNPNQSTAPAEDDTDQPALVRYARLKQREVGHTRSAPNLGPRVITSPPHRPEKWSVTDTSVQIASAFHQAASTSVEDSMATPNDSWASGTIRKPNVPRSTSVEYEKETQSTVTRRLGAPSSNRIGARATKPLAKTASIHHVPDSEGEDNGQVQENGRGKSPFEQIKRFVPAAFYLRSPSQEPENSSATNNINANTSSSYDYSAEEREYQASSNSQKVAPRKTAATHRRNRMSTDNKAYRPTISDLENSDEDFEEDGKRSRKKKSKKGTAGGGPLTTLPVAGYDKRKKRRKAGARGNEAEDDEESSEDQEEEQQEHHRVSEQRSVRGTTPYSQGVSANRAGSIPRPGSSRFGTTQLFPEEFQKDSNAMESSDVEQALHSIPEMDEPPEIDAEGEPDHRSFSVGAMAGRLVHFSYSLFFRIVGAIYAISSFFTSTFSRTIRFSTDLIFYKPVRWISRSNPKPFIRFIAKYALIAFCMYAVWIALTNGYFTLPSRSPTPPYQPPEMPPADVTELSARLQRLETALASLSLDTARSRTYIEGDGKHQAELAGRIGALETKVQKESTRAQDVEAKFKATTHRSLLSVQQEMQTLRVQIDAQQRESGSRTPGPSNDEEARAKLKALEERVGSVEGGVKEALELGKSAVKIDGAASSVVAWWNKLASGKGSPVTIKSTDGQDVTSLINHLVDSAVSKVSKDTLARADFALHSGGARVIPSLTSDTFEVTPRGLGSQILGVITGNGYAIGRPPVTALHHEIHNGHCWPFAGSRGQLAVALSTPAYISDITIDHVAKEVATDMRSAPRQMELWGLVEGQDNMDKVKEFQKQKALRREEARVQAELTGEPYAVEEESPYPPSLPKSPPYVRIANFTYNIHAPNHIQTFSVSQEIQDLGVDFGVVVLLINNNWGREEFTCLYRLRVHGERMGEMPLPYSEEDSS